MSRGDIILGSYEPYPLLLHGDVMLGTYEPYPLLLHGDVMLGTYEPYPLPINGALMIGEFNLGTIPSFYNPSLISAIARIDQNLNFPQFIIGGLGGSSGSSYVLFKKSTNQVFTIWRSKVFQIGKDFDVLKITFHLVTDLEANTSVIPKLYFDSERTSAVGIVIDITKYDNENKLIELTAKNFSNSVSGKHNFFFELQFVGTALAVLALPISIEINEHE